MGSLCYAYVDCHGEERVVTSLGGSSILYRSVYIVISDMRSMDNRTGLLLDETGRLFPLLTSVPLSSMACVFAMLDVFFSTLLSVSDADVVRGVNSCTWMVPPDVFLECFDAGLVFLLLEIVGLNSRALNG